jgi:DNA repair exonuclease SbcCD nuclease subunit
MVASSQAEMLTFLHSADWQIGKPYARVSDFDKRARLRQVRIEAIARIGALIPSCQAQFLLVAGDLFDSPTPSNSDVSAVCQAIGRLSVPVLVIPGNHDHGAPGSVWHSPYFQSEQQQRAPNLQVLLKRQVVELDEAIVLPCPLLRRHESDDPTQWVRQLDWCQLPANKPRILLAHGSVHGFEAADLDADDNNPNSSNRLQLDQSLLQHLDYAALGDWHGCKQISPICWYSGTPEPDRFPRHTNYQSGQVLAVHVQRGEAATVQMQPTGVLQWQQMQVRLQQSGDLERLEQQLDPLLRGEPGQQLLLLEQTGSLNLEAHRRYQHLLLRLEAQLLRLKQRGEIEQQADPTELRALTNRSDAPLIAQVACSLEHELNVNGGDNQPDPQQRALLQRALAELHRHTGACTCD